MADASLKSNIPTHEVEIGNDIVVVFYDYITTGESRELQRMLLEKGKLNSATQQIEELSLGAFLDSQERATSFVIKEVKTGGETQPFSLDWLNNLPSKIGDMIYAEVNRLTEVSKLTQDEKKG